MSDSLTRRELLDDADCAILLAAQAILSRVARDAGGSAYGLAALPAMRRGRLAEAAEVAGDTIYNMLTCAAIHNDMPAAKKAIDDKHDSVVAELEASVHLRASDLPADLTDDMELTPDDELELAGRKIGHATCIDVFPDGRTSWRVELGQPAHAPAGYATAYGPTLAIAYRQARSELEAVQ